MARSLRCRRASITPGGVMQRFWSVLRGAARQARRSGVASSGCSSPSASASASRSSSSPPARTATSTRTTRSTRTTSPTRTSSAARRCSPSSRWTRATRSTSCSPATAPQQLEGLRRHAEAQRRGRRRSSRPLTILQFSDSLVSSPDGNPTNSVAGKALLAAQAKEHARVARPRPHAPRTRSTTLEPPERDPGGRAHARQPGLGEVPPLRQPGRDPQGAAARSSPTTTRADRHPAPGQRSRSRTRARRPTLVQRRGREAALRRTRHASPPAPPVLLKDINDYLRGGMLTLGGIAVAIMVVILLVLFNVRWRLLPLLVVLIGVVWAFGLAGYLGIPLTHRHHRRAPGDARRRHRLRDPDARARRGGGGHRPRRAPDPGDRPQPRSGAARRHLRRHLRLRRAALRQGADDPRLRPAARGRHRRHLPRLDHPAARHPRHPRVQVAHQGPRLPRGSARPARRVARQPPAPGRPSCRRRQRRRSSSAAWSSRTSSRCRPTRSSGSTRTRRPSRTSTRSRSETGGSSELGVFVTSRRRVHRQVRRRSRTTSPPTTLAEVPEEAAHRLEHRDRRSATSSSTCPVRSDLAPTRRRRRRRVRRRADRHPGVDRGRRTARAFNILFRTGPGSLEDARAGRAARSATTRTRPQGIRATPSGLAVVGVGLLDNLEANRILLTYLAIALRVPVPRGPAALDHPVAAVAGAGADRGRHRRRWSPGRSASS